MDAIATLVRSIFQKDSLQECSVEELESLAREYPYFTPVQFLLAQKLKLVDETLYKEQLQKLSLHFSNPLWLDYLLNGYDEVSVIEPAHTVEQVETSATPTDQQPTEIPPEQTFIKSEPEIVEPIKEELVEPINEEIVEPANISSEFSQDHTTIETDHTFQPIPEENREDESVNIAEALTAAADDHPEEESRETAAHEQGVSE